MGHLLLTRSKADSLVCAVRRAQVAAFGGSPALASAICASTLGRRFEADEAFWQTAVQWLCTRPEVDPAQVGPVVDYLAHARVERPGFALPGRTWRSVTRDMARWHDELAGMGLFANVDFPPSEIRPARWARPNPDPEGGGDTRVVELVQLRSTRALASYAGG